MFLCQEAFLNYTLPLDRREEKSKLIFDKLEMALNWDFIAIPREDEDKKAFLATKTKKMNFRKRERNSEANDPWWSDVFRIIFSVLHHCRGIIMSVHLRTFVFDVMFTFMCIFTFLASNVAGRVEKISSQADDRLSFHSLPSHIIPQRNVICRFF